MNTRTDARRSPAAHLQGAAERRVLVPTRLGLHREIGLAVDDAVDHPGAVPVRGVIGVGGGHLHHHGSCGQTAAR